MFKIPKSHLSVSGVLLQPARRGVLCSADYRANQLESHPFQKREFRRVSLPKLERIGDPENAQDVTEYELEIYQYMKKNETKELPYHNLFQVQTNITPRMRSTVIDWIAEVHLKSKMHTDTLYLTVRLIDLYLSKIDLDKSQYQRLGCAAMLIASKNLEMHPTAVENLVELADHSFTTQELIEMESSLFNCVNFHVDQILPSMFLKRYLRLILPDNEITMLSYYICETSLLYPDYIGITPSRLAAASILLALNLEGRIRMWNQRIVRNTGYSISDLYDLVHKLLQTVISSTTSRFQAIRKKYASNQMYNVSLMQFPESLNIEDF